MIRKATENDFEKVYPLFEQLWPNKDLDKDALRIVFTGAYIQPPMCYYAWNIPMSRLDFAPMPW